MINLAWAKQEADLDECPVCHGVIHANVAQIAYRIVPTYEAMKEHGINALHNYQNWIVVCSRNCAHRVSLSWSGDKMKDRRERLLRELKGSAESGAFPEFVKVRKA